MSNPKNKLAEFCQKNKFPLPNYVYTTDEKGMWISSITVQTSVKIIKLQSGPKLNKRDADMDVSEKVLKIISIKEDEKVEVPLREESERLKKMLREERKQDNSALSVIDFKAQVLSVIDFKAQVLILIDEDNSGAILRDLSNRDANYEIISILSTNSGLIDYKNKPSIKRIQTKSAVADTSDFYIALMIQEKILSKLYKKIVLVTRDHFGQALTEAIKEFIPDSIPVVACSTLEQVLQEV